MAVLNETDLVALGPAATLWPIAFVAIAAAAGLGAGLRAAVRGSRMLGTLAAVSNGFVLVFYGFLLLFFGFDGSR